MNQILDHRATMCGSWHGEVGACDPHVDPHITRRPMNNLLKGFQRGRSQDRSRADLELLIPWKEHTDTTDEPYISQLRNMSKQTETSEHTEAGQHRLWYRKRKNLKLQIAVWEEGIWKQPYESGLPRRAFFFHFTFKKSQKKIWKQFIWKQPYEKPRPKIWFVRYSFFHSRYVFCPRLSGVDARRDSAQYIHAWVDPLEGFQKDSWIPYKNSNDAGVLPTRGLLWDFPVPGRGVVMGENPTVSWKHEE